MGKIRIYELSKRLGVTNKEILSELKKMGITGKTHSSNIDDELAGKIERIFRKDLAREEKTEDKQRTPGKKETPGPLETERKNRKKKDKPRMAGKGTPVLTPSDIIPSQEEVVDDDIALPDRFKKEIAGQKVEKLKSKSMQRAFQTLRKVEPRRFDSRGGKRHKGTHGKKATEETPAVSTALPRKKAIKIPEGTTVKEFSELIGQKVS